MDAIGWNTVLFVLKWIFIGLIYVALALVVISVRREMGLRVGGRRSAAAVAPGRLKVINMGGDPRLRLGDLLNLQIETSLGTDADNDIILRDPFISNHHARLRWDGVRWWVEDLGSRNGTYVNGVQTRPGQSQPVPAGATLALGEVSFELME